ncbi:hypothetical protein F383_16092 [Gossypium arboreum]|uniref:Uncharacterized protein n=1 Tax=Gossypium arboreum TaxID=29729 RepID=A0A0B0Q0X6_GOSAR|nr:hypothetical protein F383_16092 [Gossypium arboreum]
MGVPTGRVWHIVTSLVMPLNLFCRRIRVRGVTFYWYQSYGLVGSMTTIVYQIDPKRVIADDVESNVPAPAQGSHLILDPLRVVVMVRLDKLSIR